jgi:hypothetical protein
MKGNLRCGFVGAGRDKEVGVGMYRERDGLLQGMTVCRGGGGAVRGTEVVGCIVIKQTGRIFENFVCGC